jgi:hypothetical protein
MKSKGNSQVNSEYEANVYANDDQKDSKYFHVESYVNRKYIHREFYEQIKVPDELPNHDEPIKLIEPSNYDELIKSIEPPNHIEPIKQVETTVTEDMIDFTEPINSPFEFDKIDTRQNDKSMDDKKSEIMNMFNVNSLPNTQMNQPQYSQKDYYLAKQTIMRGGRVYSYEMPASVINDGMFWNEYNQLKPIPMIPSWCN